MLLAVTRGTHADISFCLITEEERKIAENGPAKSLVKKVKRSSPSRSNASPAPSASTSKPKKAAAKTGDAPKKKGAVADLKKKDRASTSTPTRDTGHDVSSVRLACL